MASQFIPVPCGCAFLLKLEPGHGFSFFRAWMQGQVVVHASHCRLILGASKRFKRAYPGKKSHAKLSIRPQGRPPTNTESAAFGRRGGLPLIRGQITDNAARRLAGQGVGMGNSGTYWRLKSRVCGNSGLACWVVLGPRAASLRISPGVCPMRKKRAKRRLSAS